MYTCRNKTSNFMSQELGEQVLSKVKHRIFVFFFILNNDSITYVNICIKCKINTLFCSVLFGIIKPLLFQDSFILFVLVTCWFLVYVCDVFNCSCHVLVLGLYL